MKKVFLAICAMAAVLACTKTEATFEQPSQISFSPVSKFNTKAAESGNDFTQNFYAFANTTGGQKYFANVQFQPATSQPDNAPAGKTVYVGNPAQYWPNQTALIFAGCTESGNVGAGASVTMNEQFDVIAVGTSAVPYAQPYDFGSAENNDFMWFFDGNNDAGYTKSTTYLQPVMKHACSWITIKVALDADLDNYWIGVKVTNIQFESLKTTGVVNLGATAEWNTLDGEQSGVNIYDDATGTAITANSVVVGPENNVIVIPQSPATLSMEYSYTAPAGGTVTETVTGISLKYDGDVEWAAGTHYTYTLTIGADEIKIAPSSADWSTGAGAGLEQEVK